MARIKISPETLEEQARNLDRLIGQHNDIYKEMGALVNNLALDWEGQANAEFAQSFSLHGKSFVKFATLVGSFSGRMRSAATDMRAADEAVRGRMVLTRDGPQSRRQEINMTPFNRPGGDTQGGSIVTSPSQMTLPEKTGEWWLTQEYQVFATNALVGGGFFHRGFTSDHAGIDVGDPGSSVTFPFNFPAEVIHDQGWFPPHDLILEADINGQTYFLAFGHLSESSSFNRGDVVPMGSNLGYTGNSGDIFTHLHFEVRRATGPNSTWSNSTASRVDPVKFIGEHLI